MEQFLLIGILNRRLEIEHIASFSKISPLTSAKST